MLDMKMDMQEGRHEEEQSDIVCRTETKECKCSELELRCKKAVEKCAEFELEILTKKIEYDFLLGRMKKLEVEKSAIEEELKVLMGKGYESGQQVSCVKGINKICFEEEKKEGIVNLINVNEDEDEVVQLMIENNVLTCEKKKAESEVEVWKDKCEKLTMWISKLDQSFVMEDGEPVFSGRFERVIGSPDLTTPSRVLEGVTSTRNSLGKGIGDLEAGTPSNGPPHNHTVSMGEQKNFGGLKSDFNYRSRVRKQLYFDEESASKKIAPSTPAGYRSTFHGIIDIVDSDDEPIIAEMPNPENHKSDVFVSSAQDLSGCGSLCHDEKIGEENNLEELHCERKNVEDMEDDFTFYSTPKRKRASNIITSDTESDDEDDVPICKLKRIHLQGSDPIQVSSKLNDFPTAASTSPCDEAAFSATPARRRLVPLRKCYEKGSEKINSSSQSVESKNHRSVPTNEGVEEELEDVGSELESEGESLGGFIVDNSDVSDVGNSSQSENLSNNSVEYDEIISKLGRRKKNLKWEHEADMLAAFGKDPELCMRAVCALYRQQTSEEKVSKETLFSNKRGFSKFDATKGTRLAEFLTNGDPQGNLNKSAKELQEYDPNAIDLCRKLATHYSKQLFEIYESKEDPFFLPA